MEKRRKYMNIFNYMDYCLIRRRLATALAVCFTVSGSGKSICGAPKADTGFLGKKTATRSRRRVTKLDSPAQRVIRKRPAILSIKSIKKTAAIQRSRCDLQRTAVMRF
jgi:hypothetical protein